MFRNSWSSILSLSVSALFCLTIAGMAQGKMVGYWPMDEGEGVDVADASGTGNDGIIKGKVDWVDGVKGKALEFDGVSGWLDCGNDASLQLEGPITCMFWLNPLTEIEAGLPRWNLVYFAYGPMFRTLDGGQILTWLDWQSGAAGTGVTSKRNNWPVGEWFHLACVYEKDAALIFYINGDEDGQKLAVGEIKKPRAGFFGIGGIDFWTFGRWRLTVPGTGGAECKEGSP